MSASFYTVAYVGFGFPLLLASLSPVVDVAWLLAVLTGVAGALALQQFRERM